MHDVPQLSPESTDYLRGRPKSERSPLGQFLTPKVLRDQLVAQVPLADGMRVLDPGVGTGEFLKTCLEVCPGIETYGWDVDPRALNVARRLVPEADLRERSALEEWTGDQFDVVIGNPPYFEIRNLESTIREDFKNVISGRPNIFALFFLAGWRVLKDSGYLAYVVPPSMNNGAYFEQLRNFIIANFSIEYFKVFEDPFLFEDAQTAVQLIVLRKGHSSSRHWIDLGILSHSPKSRRVFVEDKESFARSFHNSTSLYNLGYQAVTGSVVWNNRKSDLREVQDEDAVALLWAHNITSDRHVVLDQSIVKKPQFVVEARCLEGPSIVVNRITGSVGSGSLRCALVPVGEKFVGENHVNVIVPRADVTQKVDWNGLLDLLRAPGINKRVRALTGNTQISATELTHWIPLDLE